MGRSQEPRRSRSPRNTRDRRRSPKHYSTQRRSRYSNRVTYDKNTNSNYKGLRAWNPTEFPEVKHRTQTTREDHQEDWASQELKESEEKGYSVDEIPSKPINKNNSQWQHDKFDLSNKDSDTVRDIQIYKTRSSPTYS